MNEDGKSDSAVVPKNRSNKGLKFIDSAEIEEERALAKGNSSQQSRFRTQGREDLSQALMRIRESACKDSKQRFTALWHHVYNIDNLRQAFFALKRSSAAGIDGLTWDQYCEDLEERLTVLSLKLRRGSYRAAPVMLSLIHI